MNEDDFIRAMLSEPDNDMHRLLYADWLEENGNEEIASLIREAHGWTPLFQEGLRWHIRFYRGSNLICLINSHIVCRISLCEEQYRHLGGTFIRLNYRGDTYQNKYNWIWLLSLGMKHGLDIN